MGMLDYVLRRSRERLVAGDVPHWLEASPRRRYIEQVIWSAPPWVDRRALRLIQLRARQMTELSGVEHHISHIIPLNHPRVCGMTVPWNLEIKPAKVNLAESNHIHLDEQLSLFGEEQAKTTQEPTRAEARESPQELLPDAPVGV